MPRNVISGGLLVSMVVGFLMAGCQPAAEPAYQNPRVQEEAASVHSPIVGLKAPDFTLPDANGKDASLSLLRGQWVVLYFYPKDDTPGCTCEATEFTTLGTGFKDMNAKVLGISDDSAEIHRIFIQKFKLSLDLLSDPNHGMMRRYGAWVDAYLGDTKYERMIRSTVLIDPAGVVRYHWPEVIPKGHAERVKEKLALLQAGPVTSRPSR